MILFLLKKKIHKHGKLLEGHISKYLSRAYRAFCVYLCFSVLSKMLTICITLTFYCGLNNTVKYVNVYGAN